MSHAASPGGTVRKAEPSRERLVGGLGSIAPARGELGFSALETKLGGQYNHIKNARRGSDVTSIYDLGPGTYGAPGILDAASDQRAIYNGNKSSPRLKEKKEAELERLQKEIKSIDLFKN